MTTIDERVVQMVFKNDQFERGVQQSLGTLTKLKNSLQLNGATKGLDNITTAANNVDLSGISAGVEAIQNRFSTLGIISMRVISNLTDAAMNMAGKITRFLTGGVIQGGISRAMNIEQAKFQLQGLGIAWKNIEEDINYGVKDTAYGLDSAAVAASQLVASGVEFGKTFGTTGNSPMAKALRGISGVAAMTNSSYEDTARIFTTVAGNGRLMGDQLNQLGARGLNAAAILGEAMGKSEQEIRDMTSKGQISFQQFADIMDDKFGQHAKDANKTFTGAMSNIKAALARIGADFAAPFIKMENPVVKTMQTIIDMIDRVHDITKPIAKNISTYLLHFVILFNNAISSFDVETSFNSFVEGLSLIYGFFKKIGTVAFPILKSLFNAFSNIELSNIYEALKAIGSIGDNLNISQRLVGKIKDSFDSLFSIITRIGNSLFKGIKRFLVDLGGAEKIANIISGFLSPLKLIVALAQKIGGLFQSFNNEGEKTYPILFGLLSILEKIAITISEIVSGILDDSKIGRIVSGLKRVSSVMNEAGLNTKNFTKVTEKVSHVTEDVDRVVDKTKDTLENIGNVIKNVTSYVKEFAKAIGDRLKGAFGSVNFKSISSSLMALFAGLSVFKISQLLNKLAKPILLFEKIVSDGKISQLFTSLKASLQQFQNSLRAKSLKELAIAIGILAASMLVMSAVDPKRMAASLGGLTGILADLMGALFVMNKLSTNMRGAIAFSTLSKALIALSAAVLILSVAVKILSSIKTEDLVKGLIGLTVIFGELAAFLRVLSGHTKGAIKASVAITILSIAIGLLTASVAVLGHMNLTTLAKGLGSIAIGLGILVGALALMPSKIVGSVGILVLALAIEALVPAIVALGNLDLVKLAKGLGGIAVALGLLVGASILAQSAIPGAAAIFIIAAALTLLVPALVALGNMKFGKLAKGLGMLALAIVALVGLSVLVSVFAVELLILAGVLTALSIAVVLFGTGVLALAAGLQIITTLGSAAADAMALLLMGVINLIPQFAASVAEGITVFIETLAASAGRIAQAVLGILITIINTLADNAEQLVEAGFNLLISLVEGILKGLWKVAQAAWEAIKEFVNGLIHDPESVYTAGQKVINKALEGLKEKLGDWYDIGVGCLRGFLGGLGNSRAIGDIATAAADAGKTAYNAAKKALEEQSPSKKFKELGMYADAGLALGLRQFSNLPEKAAKSMALSVIDTISNDMDSFGLSPRITPILDTTNIEKNAGRINALLDSKRSISVGTLNTSGISTDSLSQTMFNFKMIEALSNLRSTLAGNTQPNYSVYINGDYNNDEGVRGITKNYLEELIQYSEM